MQPNSNDAWRQPDQQPPQAPYVAPPEEQPIAPVVTMSPDAQLSSFTPTTTPAVTPSPEAATEPTQAAEQTPPAQPEESPVDDQVVQWRATEYIQQDKNTPWFVAFALVTLGLMAIAIFVIQSWTFAVLVPVMAVALLTYTQRPPRLMSYSMSRKGLHVNDHLYPFVDFKAFGVIHDGAEYSIMLVPTKRFRPGVSVYFPENVGEQLVDMLGTRLPMRELHLDFVDRLIRKLRI